MLKLSLFYMYLIIINISNSYSFVDFKAVASQIAQKNLGVNCLVQELVYSSHTTSDAFFKITSNNKVNFLKFSRKKMRENSKLKKILNYMRTNSKADQILPFFILPYSLGTYDAARICGEVFDWNISKFIEGDKFATALIDYIFNPSEEKLRIFEDLGKMIGTIHLIGGFEYVDRMFRSDFVHGDLHPYNIIIAKEGLKLVDNGNLLQSNNVMDDINRVLLHSTPFPMMLYCHALENVKKQNFSKEEIEIMTLEQWYIEGVKRFIKVYFDTIKFNRDLLFQFKLQLIIKMIDSNLEFYIKDQDFSNMMHKTINVLSRSDIICVNDRVFILN